MTQHPTETHSHGEAWVRRSCALVVAGVAAYSSYAHQRHFALAGGADHTGAALWPLSVDGLVILATLGLVRIRPDTTLRARIALWLAFLLGIAVSLAANIAAALALGWQPVLVAGWPPLALLLAVELIVHSRGRDQTRETAARETTVETPGPLRMAQKPHTENIKAETPERDTRTKPDNWPTRTPAKRPTHHTATTAEAIMWAHYETEQKAGRTPSGAELDRVAGTNNYGRAVLARWRSSGRVPATAAAS